MTAHAEGTPSTTQPPRMKVYPYPGGHAAAMRTPISSRPTPILVSEGAIVSAPGGPFMLRPTPRPQWAPTSAPSPTLHDEGPTCTKVVVHQVRVAAWVDKPHYPTTPWVVWCSCGHVITTQPQATWARAMAVAWQWVSAVQRMRHYSGDEHEQSSKDKAKRGRKRKREQDKTKDKRKVSKDKHKSKHKAKAKA